MLTYHACTEKYTGVTIWVFFLLKHNIKWNIKLASYTTLKKKQQLRFDTKLMKFDDSVPPNPKNGQHHILCTLHFTFLLKGGKKQLIPILTYLNIPNNFNQFKGSKQIKLKQRGTQST